MNILNTFTLENRPLLKYTIITLLVVNTIILGCLLFRPEGLQLPSFLGNNNGGGPAAAGAGSTLDETAEEEEEREDEEEGSHSSGHSSEDGMAEEDDRDESEYGSSAGSDEEADSENEEGELRMPPRGPLLELTDEHITLKVGEEFDFYKYIKTMVDRDGTSLSRYIHLSGHVDVWQPGDYPITYTITSQIDGESASEDLLVTVEY